jgi:hypothetical protein
MLQGIPRKYSYIIYAKLKIEMQLTGIHVRLDDSHIYHCVHFSHPYVRVNA